MRVKPPRIESLTLQDWPINCDHRDHIKEMNDPPLGAAGPGPDYICFCTNCLMLWNPQAGKGWGLDSYDSKLIDLFKILNP